MAAKTHKWIRWNSQKKDPEEEEEEDTEEEEEEKKSEDDDDMETDDDGEKTFVQYVEDIADEPWTQDLTRDLEMIKRCFKNYLFNSGITKTKFFEDFQEEFQEEEEKLIQRYQDDGVEKSDEDIGDAAYEETFNTFQERLQDVIQDIYRRQNEEEDNAWWTLQWFASH